MQLIDYFLMITHLWHNLLNMKKYNKAWHEEDMDDEYKELLEAKTLIEKWSEYSDVSYTYSRAKWSGHKMELPISKGMYFIGLIYMYPKYSMRFLFFKRAANKLGAQMREVRNPQKVEKLHALAEKYDIPAQEFSNICKRQLRYWPLLK